MKIFLWIVTILACIVAGFIFFMTVTASTSAPQEAAGSAMACTVAIIPYILARAVEKLADKGQER